jgi:FkbM family methyltransferase
VTLKKPNRRPRSLKIIQPALRGDEQFVIADVGARGGIESYWRNYAGDADFICFEPEPEECKRLNVKAAGTRRKFYPFALGARGEERPFYVAEFSHSSSLFAAREDFFLRRFPYSTLRTVDTGKMRTVTLDQFAQEHNIGNIDFIKVDVEGAELDVLTGAVGLFERGRILGIKTELWLDPKLRGQPSYAELDQFLRSHGFRLFDVELSRYSKSTMPVGRLKGMMVGPFGIVVGAEQIGQVLTGDALYFRDPVGELVEGTQRTWDEAALLRLCALLDTFGYPDSAIEIVEHFREKFKMRVNVDDLIDSLLPPMGGRRIGYHLYRSISNNMRIATNLRSYGRNTWHAGNSIYGRESGPKAHILNLATAVASAKTRVRDLQRKLRRR